MNTTAFRPTRSPWALLAATATLAAVFAAPAAAAAAGVTKTDVSEAQERHRQDVEVCASGQSNQDRATCMREAEAALMEAKRGGQSDGNANYERNQTRRCDRLPGEQRTDCMSRMQGQGTTSGSVSAGGLYRELVTREQAPPEPAADTPAPPQ